MKNNDAILKKIKKCIALSKSANEHEAALALKQAQALMKKHGIDDQTVAFSDVTEQATSAKTKSNPPEWSCSLARLCADAFACETIIRKRWGESTSCIFIGVAHNAYMAAYAYEVLLRQLTKARKDYYANNNKRCKQSTRIYRANQFALGYVLRLDEKVNEFANPAPKVVKDYMQKTHGSLTEIQRRKSAAATDGRAQSGNEDAMSAGWKAGKDASLHRPVGKEQERLL